MVLKIVVNIVRLAFLANASVINITVVKYITHNLVASDYNNCTADKSCVSENASCGILFDGCGEVGCGACQGNDQCINGTCGKKLFEVTI